MDILTAVQQLREERARLDAMIAILESRIDWEHRKEPGEGVRRRGRKAMSLEERLQVSERMRRYWAARRGVATSS